MEVFVDLNGGTDEPARGSDCSSQWPIVLRTGVDLTPITAGLEHASGWFSLSDRSLFSRAQLKVSHIFTVKLFYSKLNIDDFVIYRCLLKEVKF